ncbi:cytochrome P450 [Phaeosphaeria sp. MPI-PUGE-AT-0046c]|nr:cytochrome P450 [Phaeosphaeria sp. MPI-PUGE-AT-0046c]
MASLNSTSLFSILPCVISLHLLVLRRFEFDHLPLAIIALSSIVYAALVYYLHLGSATVIAFAFWGTLGLWTAAYRLFFHPLRNYPGPFFAKLWKWWSVKQAWTTGLRFHRTQQQLQKQYGDYVRTGPRELTIFDVDAVPVIYGVQAKTSKGTFFDMMERTLHQTRDKQFHRQRRRIWDGALKASLSDFAPRVEEFTDQLLQRLRNLNGEPLPLLDNMTYYSYDVMSLLAFQTPMGFVKGEQLQDAQEALDIMTGSLEVFGLLHHVPWLMQMLFTLGSVAPGPLKTWTQWSVKHMQARLAIENAKPDLVSRLADNTPKDAAGRALLYGESRLILGAGGETSSTALTFIFVHLATHPRYIKALREEFRENASTYSCQRPLPLLDAIINESMRRSPSALLNSPRETPPEGIEINGHYVPGGTIVQMPPFVLNHDPRHFVNPDDFIPERWLDRADLVLRKDAFIPFLTGPYSCAGKNLAMMEMRSVIGRVINEFDVIMPKGFIAEEYWNAIKDKGMAGPPSQDVMFVKVVEE